VRGVTAPVRLAELLVGFSAIADLGMGLPVGEAARAAYVAVELARGQGSTEPEVADVFAAALLQHIGCTAYSHEVSLLFADETVVKQTALRTDFTRPREIVFGYLPGLVRGAAPGERLRTVRSAVLHSRRMTEGYQLANCEAASLVARRLGLPEPVSAGLLDVFEWWNGGGGPRRLSGESISPVARLVNVAGYAVLFDRLGGPEAAAAAVAQRSGGYLDPGIAAWFVERAADLLAPTAAGDFSDRLLAAEPGPPPTVPTDRLDDVLHVFGDAVDLKSPFLHGHSAGVSALAAGAAQRLRLASDQVDLVRRAAIVQDIGRVTVPTAIWEHPGPLGSDAWAQVRLHAYHSEQMLGRCTALAPLATLAGMHHDRLDGSGYHRGAGAAQLTIPARVLAAADAFHALRSPRPHRAALPPERAAAVLRGEARAGRLDADAVAAVLATADGASTVRRAGPAGLTGRQAQVLRLVARGLSNRAIGAELVISPRTAEHHVQDVYARIGVSSRAAAALYAMQHGLLTQDG
jgi:HD-GYP domain-containing protein (c-di-GMP phosphodiesterase class II)/DNA-binding CsgD family transcriptional regulator